MPGKWCLGTGKKWCRVQTLSARLHSYSVSPLNDAILKLELSSELQSSGLPLEEEWTSTHSALRLCFLQDGGVFIRTSCFYDNPRINKTDPVPAFVPEGSSGTGALYPSSSVCTWKKGVFTLVSSECRTRAPYPGTKCERCLFWLFPRLINRLLWTTWNTERGVWRRSDNSIKCTKKFHSNWPLVSSKNRRKSVFTGWFIQKDRTDKTCYARI